MNAGRAVMEALYRDLLKVDPARSIRTANGFTWWADQYAQQIQIAGEAQAPNGDAGTLLAVRTELFRDLTLDDRAASALNSRLMAFASLAGPVYDFATRRLYLYSQVRLYDDTRPWLTRLLGIAALVQLDEARRLAPELAALLRAGVAASGHPARGLRPEPGDMADIIPRRIVRLGCEPSRWAAAEFADTLAHYLQHPPALQASGSGPGCTVEFPYGNQFSLFQAMGDQPHPHYGNGLFVLQSFPVGDLADAEGMRLALALNADELAGAPAGYGLGSYCYQRNLLHFVSFFPNLAYRPGLLPNLYCAAAWRARALAVRFTGQDWTASSFAPARSAIGRRLNRRDVLNRRLGSPIIDGKDHLS